MIQETEITSTEYQLRDDESEAKQLQDLSGTGDVIYPDDNDIRSYSLEGLGITGGDR